MSKKTTEDLYEHLFAAIAGVREGTVTIEQAKAIGDLSQVVVNVAKVESDYLRHAGRGSSRFIAIDSERSPTAAPILSGPLPNGITGVYRHLLKDE